MHRRASFKIDGFNKCSSVSRFYECWLFVLITLTLNVQRVGKLSNIIATSLIASIWLFTTSHEGVEPVCTHSDEVGSLDQWQVRKGVQSLRTHSRWTEWGVQNDSFFVWTSWIDDNYIVTIFTTQWRKWIVHYVVWSLGSFQLLSISQTSQLINRQMLINTN